MKDCQINFRVTKNRQTQMKQFAATLFNNDTLERPEVGKLIELAVDEYMVNPSHLAPQTRSRLISFSMRCCGGRMDQAVKMLLQNVGV